MGYQTEVEKGYIAFGDFVEDVAGCLEEIYAKIKDVDELAHDEVVDCIEDVADDLSRLIDDIRMDRL